MALLGLDPLQVDDIIALLPPDLMAQMQAWASGQPPIQIKWDFEEWGEWKLPASDGVTQPQFDGPR